MSENRKGEPISLMWECSPDFWAVRGHVDHLLAAEWAREDTDRADMRVTVEHAWGQWSMDGHERRQVLRVHHEPGRGRFPITVAEDADEIDRLAALRRHMKDKRAAGMAAAESRWPMAEVESVAPQADPHPAKVWLRFPGLQGRVTWDVGSDHVFVERRDQDAWRDMYGAAKEEGR